MKFISASLSCLFACVTRFMLETLIHTSMYLFWSLDAGQISVAIPAQVKAVSGFHSVLISEGPVWGLLPPSGEFEVDLYGGARNWSGASLGLLYRLKIKDVVNEATLFLGGLAGWLAGCLPTHSPGTRRP